MAAAEEFSVLGVHIYRLVLHTTGLGVGKVGTLGLLLE